MINFIIQLLNLIMILAGAWILIICAKAFIKGFKKGYNKNKKDDGNTD